MDKYVINNWISIGLCIVFGIIILGLGASGWNNCSTNPWIPRCEVISGILLVLGPISCGICYTEFKKYKSFANAAVMTFLIIAIIIGIGLFGLGVWGSVIYSNLPTIIVCSKPAHYIFLGCILIDILISVTGIYVLISSIVKTRSND